MLDGREHEFSVSEEKDFHILVSKLVESGQRVVRILTESQISTLKSKLAKDIDIGSPSHFNDGLKVRLHG